MPTPNRLYTDACDVTSTSKSTTASRILDPGLPRSLNTTLYVTPPQGTFTEFLGTGSRLSLSPAHVSRVHTRGHRVSLRATSDTVKPTREAQTITMLAILRQTRISMTTRPRNHLAYDMQPESTTNSSKFSKSRFSIHSVTNYGYVGIPCPNSRTTQSSHVRRSRAMSIGLVKSVCADRHTTVYQGNSPVEVSSRSANSLPVPAHRPEAFPTSIYTSMTANI